VDLNYADENVPVWEALFSNSGLQVVISDESIYHLYKSGWDPLCRITICFRSCTWVIHQPDIEKKVNRYFSPFEYTKRNSISNQRQLQLPHSTAYSRGLKRHFPFIGPFWNRIDSPVLIFNDMHFYVKASGLFKKVRVDKTVFNNALLLPRKPNRI